MGNQQTQTRLRLATDSDCQFLFEVFASTCDVGIIALGDGPHNPILKMQFDAKNQHYSAAFPKATDYIVEAESQTTGKRFPIGRLLTDETSDRVHIVDIAILPDFRERGIGASIITSVLELAHKNDKLVFLSVNKLNRAVDLYKRLGFEKSGESELYCEMTAVP